MFTQHLNSVVEAVSSAEYTQLDQMLTETDAFRSIISELESVKERCGTVYVVGNGGSAGIASHFATDLLKALQIPAQTLYDSNITTCLSNDFGYENVFSYQLQHLFKKQDVLVAISSSGASQNILKAVDVASKKGGRVITFSGFRSTNPLRNMGHINAYIPSDKYGIVEMGHMCMLHTLIDLYSVSVQPACIDV